MHKELYDELGVAPDASPADIRKGYRRRVKKTHPDAKGGSATAFGKTNLAMMILLDPERRARYDADGTMKEPEPDNKRAKALQIIESFVASTISDYIQTWENDPRHRDLVSEFLVNSGRKMLDLANMLQTGKRVISFYEDMLARFTTTEPVNIMERSIAAKIEEAKRIQTNIEQDREALIEAMKIMRTYKFRADAEGGMPNFFRVSDVVFIAVSSPR